MSMGDGSVYGGFSPTGGNASVWPVRGGILDGPSTTTTSTGGGTSTTTTTINPTIAQTPMSGLPGTTFTQWGTGFTPYSTATLHFQKPDGTEYPTASQAIDATGHFEITYTAPMDKPQGIYIWWAIDSSGKKSNEVSYQITGGESSTTTTVTCNPPKTVYVNNSKAYGIFEGNYTIIDATTVDIDIQGTKSPIPVIGGSLHFWTTIDFFSDDPSCLKEFGPNPDDAVGSEYAEKHMIAPGTHASYRASFCKAGNIIYKLEVFSPKAIAYTMADILLTGLTGLAGFGIPINDINTFVNDISNPDDFPSINSALVHIKNAGDAIAQKK
jgi:hypothetical protein